MAPVEFEKQIKERLEERRIDPSSDAWIKISDRLERKTVSRKTHYYRYAVAAMIVGVLLSVYWIYQLPEKSPLDVVPVVESPATSPKEKNTNESGSDNISPTAVVNDSREEGLKAAEKEFQDQEQVSKKTDHFASQDIKNVSIAVEAEHDTDALIDAKIDEVVAQVTSIEEDREAITAAEVDSLLRNAQRELLADKEFKEVRTVDASSLLAGVEDELDKSFRDQVFEKLKAGFIKVRTAVADRNK